MTIHTFKVKKEKKDNPILWKIQLHLGSVLMSIILLVVIVAIAVTFIYWSNTNCFTFIPS